MSRNLGQSIGDLIGVAVPAWYLWDPNAPGGDIQALRAIALFVIGLSLWRLWRRWRQS